MSGAKDNRRESCCWKLFFLLIFVLWLTICTIIQVIHPVDNSDFYFYMWLSPILLLCIVCIGLFIFIFFSICWNFIKWCCFPQESKQECDTVQDPPPPSYNQLV
jgi:uncharacterized membrane protein YhaH (DUF805 family)